MKRDIRKAVEEIKSAGMEDFLHQDPSTFECDDDCSSKVECSDDCNCPRTRCTRVKHCTFVTKCTHVKKWTFVTKCTRVRVQKWTFVTKVTRRKECVLVTKRTRRKHCTFVTKCVRFEKKFYWTKRCYCKNASSSLTDTVALAMIHVIMVKTVTIADTNGMIAKADINSHLAKIRNLITSGIKNVTASFYTTQKGRFAAFYIY